MSFPLLETLHSAEPDGRYQVPVVLSTFKILEELARSGSLGLHQITQRTGVAKSTAFRVLSTLVGLGYVIRDENKCYFSSPSIASLINESSLADGLRRVALPHMLRLRDRFRETVNLGRLHLDRVQYIEVAPSEYALRLHERPGALVDLHASALGKAILAFSPQELSESLLRGRPLESFTDQTVTDARTILAELAEVRETGVAFDRGEISSMATCVAAAIVGADGCPVAAMSVSGPTTRFNPTLESPVIEALRQAAEEISQAFRSRRIDRDGPASA